MLTYQLQRRRFAIKGESGRYTFPADVVVEFQFEPQALFGGRIGQSGHLSSRTIPLGAKVSIQWDANRARTYVIADKALDPVEAGVHYANVKYGFRGQVLSVATRCESWSSLEQLIVAVHAVVPPLLNVEFLDPPVIVSTSGTISGTPFTWEHVSTEGSFDVTTTERQEERLARTVEQFSFIVASNDDRRLIAALCYFHVACRLLSVGSGLWEFMAEVILNLTKTLQALFGGTRDEIRAGLRMVGVSDMEIRQVFDRIELLRSHFDVAHISVGVHKQDDLQLIYSLLEKAEARFRTLLQTVIEGLREAKFSLPPYSSSEERKYDREMRGVIDALRREQQRNIGPKT